MSREFESGENWSSRGYLPHYNAGDKCQFITYRLFDSLPKDFQWKEKGAPSFQFMTREQQVLSIQRIEDALDRGYGSCLLEKDENAKIVVDSWRYFDGSRYDLLAYVVLPNHVHVLIRTYKDYPLPKLAHSWKSFTAHAFGQGGKVWQREYWDRFIRNEAHYYKVIAYIHNNPVKAGLCNEAQDWEWSSARDL